MKIEQTCKGCYWLKTAGMDSIGAVAHRCKLGRLGKFENNGATVTLQDNYPVINGRHCLAYRREKWADDKPKHKLDVILRAEMLVQTEVYVYVEKYEHPKLETTIASLQQQILKPCLVVVICNCQPQTAKMMKLMDECGLPYKTVVMKQELTKNEIIDLQVQKSNATLYQILNQGQCLKKDWLASLDEAVNENLQRFLYIDGNENQGPTVNVAAHLNFYGNMPCKASLFSKTADPEKALYDIKEKLEFMGEINNNKHYIIKQTDIKS